MLNKKESYFIVKQKHLIEPCSLLTAYLCPEIRECIKGISEEVKNQIEEIRLRAHRPLMIYVNNQDFFVKPSGALSADPAGCVVITPQNIENTMQFISNYSIYAVEEELKRGYITVQGGHRVGIAGKVLHDQRGIKTIKDFSGLNIRISREKKGVASKILKYLIEKEKGFMNTLIISPPQCGKTTLLRDIIRSLSEGVPSLHLKGIKVGVVDERSEIGACYLGIPQNDLGPRTDILDNCPKAEGMTMLIRAMSPQVIATDEIGRIEDSIAVEEALMAGIKLITTVHGKSLEDALSKKIIGGLIKRNIFERLIVLSNCPQVGTVESIIDGHKGTILTAFPILNRMVD